jgi:hypothetical protein
MISGVNKYHTERGNMMDDMRLLNEALFITLEMEEEAELAREWERNMTEEEIEWWAEFDIDWEEHERLLGEEYEPKHGVEHSIPYSSSDGSDAGGTH